MNDEPPIGVIVIISFALIFGIGYGMGSTSSKYDYVSQGRNQGIIFCTEKQQECKIEYTYLKLKENQK